MVRNRIQDIARDEDNAAISGASVSLRKLIDNSEIATTTTDSGGLYGFTEAEVGYPGPVKVRVTGLDGVTRERTGKSTGQTGTYFHSDLMRAFSIMNNGVVAGYENELEVTAAGLAMEVTVDTGLFFMEGHPLYFSEATDVVITANASGNPRIDVIAISFTMPGENEEGSAEIIAIAGTPAGSPTAPALTQTSALWQESLAEVAVANGASAIALGNVTDDRTYSTGPLFDGSVTTAVLADGAVTNVKVASGIDAVKIADGTISNTEFQYLNNVSSNVQTQLDAKAATSHTHLLAAGATDVTATATELNILDGATLTVTELNYVDGVTSAIQTQLDAKLATTTAASTYAPLAGATFTGDVKTDDSSDIWIGTTSPVVLANSLGDLTVSNSIHVTGGLDTSEGLSADGDLILGTATTGGKIRLPERTSKPTVAHSTAAGTGGSVGAAIIRGGTDTAGTIRVTTGTSGVTTGVIATVTFATARSTNEYGAHVTGQSVDSAIGLTCANITTTGFDIRCTTAPGTEDTVDIFYTVFDLV